MLVIFHFLLQTHFLPFSILKKKKKTLIREIRRVNERSLAGEEAGRQRIVQDLNTIYVFEENESHELATLGSF